MNSQSIFTRKSLGLDNRVWRLMIAMALLSTLLLSYTLLHKETCTPFTFTIKTLGIHPNDVYYTGETISFIASTPAKDISWAFGDNTGDVGPAVHHQFLKEGIVMVTARGNLLCETEKQITIKNPPVVIRPSGGSPGSIAGPASCFTFTEQRFTWPGAAKSYVWSIPNHESLGIRTGQTIMYTFNYSGKYTLQVELDSDRTKRYFMDITVEDEIKPKSQLPKGITPLIVQNNPVQQPSNAPAETATVQKPPETEPINTEPKKKNLFIANESFRDLLEQLMNKQMGIHDFDKYLCGGETTPVVVNGNKRDLKDFKWLCNELSGPKKKMIIFKKKIKIEKAELIRDNDCVTRIEVDYK